MIPSGGGANKTCSLARLSLIAPHFSAHMLHCKWQCSGIVNLETNIIVPDYKGFRFPPEIKSHAIRLHFRFSLSFRDVEELLAQRAIVVIYEMVRQWCLKFGQTYANGLRRRHPSCGEYGIWMRSCLRFAGTSTIFGERWISMVMCCIFGSE